MIYARFAHESTLLGSDPLSCSGGGRSPIPAPVAQKGNQSIHLIYNSHIYIGQKPVTQADYETVDPSVRWTFSKANFQSIRLIGSAD